MHFFTPFQVPWTSEEDTKAANRLVQSKPDSEGRTAQRGRDRGNEEGDGERGQRRRDGGREGGREEGREGSRQEGRESSPGFSLSKKSTAKEIIWEANALEDGIGGEANDPDGEFITVIMFIALYRDIFNTLIDVSCINVSCINVN